VIREVHEALNIEFGESESETETQGMYRAADHKRPAEILLLDLPKPEFLSLGLWLDVLPYKPVI
jgi:hypothetical protein